MAFRKLGENDFFLNTMKAHPYNEFFIYNAYVTYNNQSFVTGSTGSRWAGSTSTGSADVYPSVNSVPPGFISLFEYNIDRPLVGTNRAVGSYSPAPYNQQVSALEADGEPVTFIEDNGTIYAWISKDSARASFKTVGATSFNNEFQFGDVLTFVYPLSSSITREYIQTPSSSTSYNAHYVALKNRLNFYSARSPQYAVVGPEWNKNTQKLNMIHIPSIFYGTRIEPGTVSLKFYWTGSLVAELRDDRQNGELRQQQGSWGSGTTTENSGACAGVVLYDEGILLLTGSWNLNNQTAQLAKTSDGGSVSNPKWIYWGAGANDGIVKGSDGINGSTFVSASFNLSFKGSTETQVMTMMAHARRGEANYSNNPTFLKFGQERMSYTSSHVYEENPDRLMKNTVSSSFDNITASFQRQTYISKIGIYDDDRNLIAIAKLATPIKKKETSEYTFKMKMDL